MHCGQMTPYFLYRMPHALQRTRPMPMSRQSGVLEVLQQMHEWFLPMGGRGLLVRTVTSLAA